MTVNPGGLSYYYASVGCESMIFHCKPVRSRLGTQAVQLRNAREIGSYAQKNMPQSLELCRFFENIFFFGYQTVRRWALTFSIFGLRLSF